MYTISVEVEGTAPLLQHKFGVKAEADLQKSSKKVTGKIDYSAEWMDTCYQQNGMLVQPGNHFEAAMIKAAVGYKITGKRGKTYRDLFSAALFVNPAMIPFGYRVPENPPVNMFDALIYIDQRSVVVQRARVVRSRLAFAPGWKLGFEIEVHDDQLPRDVVNEVLVEAGSRIGIGDYRPRFGRFIVTKFE